MNELLKSLIEIAPLYAKVLQQDVAIGISDMEKYLALYNTGDLKFPFPVGTKLKDAGYDYVLDKVVQTKQPYTHCLSKEVTGTVAIKSIVAPIFDNGEMVGCICVAINIENHDKVENYSFLLSKSIAALNKQLHKDEPHTDDIHTIDSALTNIQEKMVHAATVKKELNRK